jgi:hypothetical protein
VLLFNELVAIMVASISAAFDDWRYVCTDCQDGESYPVPTMWHQETTLIITTVYVALCVDAAKANGA